MGNFKAFLTQRGERNVQLDLVKEMFENREACLSRGQELAAQVQQRTDELASALTVVAEKEGEWRVLLAQQLADCRPVDFGRYQERIDAHKTGIPTLVITYDTKALPNGLYNLGLRRAGSELDVSVIAAKLKGMPEFVGGGGHPFAGGAQMKDQLALDKVVEISRNVMIEAFGCTNTYLQLLKCVSNRRVYRLWQFDWLVTNSDGLIGCCFEGRADETAAVVSKDVQMRLQPVIGTTVETCNLLNK